MTFVILMLVSSIVFNQTFAFSLGDGGAMSRFRGWSRLSPKG